MDISPALILNKLTSVSTEPDQGLLNTPRVSSKMNGTLCSSFGNAVLYMPHCVRLSAKREIVSFISVKFLRMASSSPMQISRGWRSLQHKLCSNQSFLSRVNFTGWYCEDSPKHQNPATPKISVSSPPPVTGLPMVSSC